MKPTLLCALLATSLLPACATDEAAPDELAGESDADGESGKGDTADAFTYFEVTPDTRACSLDADCGGFFVSRANRAKTVCTDGSSAARCYVRSLDWSRTRLPDTLAFEAKLREGVAFLLRGDLALDTGFRAAAKIESDVATLIAPAQPMLAVGGGPDCLYAQLTVTNVTATSASITVTPSSVLSARFDGVTITATSKHAVACVDGTAPVVIKLARVDLTGAIATGQLGTPTVQVSGLTMDASQMPGAVLDMLALDRTAGDIVAKTTALAVSAVSNVAPGGNLSVSELWVPGSETGVVDGVFVLAKDNGVRCITTPCPSIGETRLNANRAATIDTIDFAASGADDATIEAASQDIAAGPGVIVVGDRYYTNSGRGKGRRAAQFWTQAR
ncbi:MAG: hypothetical protein H0T89_02570 [Deltaproteobacteria bacterium]|nr:hypothetical protein [Deltaproteobacteria bacterium]MDQ3299606.1 hypothetical protein [Myxococcota bacterium]